MEPRSALDQGGIVVKQLGFAPTALGQCQSIAARQLEQKRTFEETVLAFRALPLVKECAKLVAIAAQNPLPVAQLLKLSPKPDLDLIAFITPDGVGDACAIEDVPSHEVVCS